MWVWEAVWKWSQGPTGWVPKLQERLYQAPDGWAFRWPLVPELGEQGPPYVVGMVYVHDGDRWKRVELDSNYDLLG